MAAGACDTCGSWGCAGNHEPTITATRAEIEAALLEAYRAGVAREEWLNDALAEDAEPPPPSCRQVITAALARLTEEAE